MKQLFFVILFFILSGCGDNRFDADYSVLAAPVDEGEYPAVVQVVMPGGRGICTGTFIGPSVVLTAAHCLEKNGAYRIYASFGKFMTANKMVFGTGKSGDPNDIGLLVLNKAYADPLESQVMRIGAPAAEGERVRLVGYGCNDLSTKLGAGKKRTGTNKVERVGTHIEVKTPLDKAQSERLSHQSSGRSVLGPIDQAGACFGDSGGPLLRQYASDRWEVVGVSHAGRWSQYESDSLYSDLNLNDNISFLLEADQNLNLDVFTSCAETGFLDRIACEAQPASLLFMSFVKNVWGWIISLF